MGLPGIEIIVAQRGGEGGWDWGEKSAKGESCGEGGILLGELQALRCVVGNISASQDSNIWRDSPLSLRYFKYSKCKVIL